MANQVICLSNCTALNGSIALNISTCNNPLLLQSVGEHAWAAALPSLTRCDVLAAFTSENAGAQLLENKTMEAVVHLLAQKTKTIWAPKYLFGVTAILCEYLSLTCPDCASPGF